MSSELGAIHHQEDLTTKNTVFVYQYKIMGDAASLQSKIQLLSFDQSNDEGFYTPYLSMSDNGKQLIAAIGGEVLIDQAACEKADDDDAACAYQPIGRLYSIPLTDDNHLSAPLLLQTENLSFDSVAVSGKHIFVGYNFYDEMGIKPSSVGVLQYEIK